MKTAKKTLFATLALASATAAIALPAAAQSYGYDQRDHGRYEQDGRWGDNRRDDNRRGNDVYNIDARQAQIAQRIEWGVRRGAIDRREAQSLRIESRDIARLEAEYRRGGLTGPEFRGIDRRLDRLENLVERDLRDRDYSAGYGYRR
jgi:Spy/CpxP family protein refolding chaperone